MRRREFLPLSLSACFGSVWGGSGPGRGAAWGREHPAMFNGDKPMGVIELTGPGGHVNSAVFSPDGSRLFVAYDDGSVRSYDASTGREVSLIRVSAVLTDAIDALAISSDGRRIAAATPFRPPMAPDDPAADFAGQDHAVTVCEVTGRVVRQLPPMKGKIVAVALNTTGDLVAAVDHTGVLRAWRVGDGSEAFSSEVHKIKGRPGEATSIRASISGNLRRAAILDESMNTPFSERTVRVIEVGDKEPRFLRHPAGHIFAIAMSADGSRVATAGDGQTISIDNFLTGQILNSTLMSLPYRVPGILHPRFVAISPSNLRVATGTEFGHVFVLSYDGRDNSNWGIQGPKGYLRAVAFQGDRIRFASGGFEPLRDQRIEGDGPRRQKFEPVKLWEMIEKK